MKKLVTLLLAAGLVFSAANSASAVEVKASGTMDFAFERYQNLGWGGGDGRGSLAPLQDTEDMGGNLHQKHGDAVTRLRVGMDFIASENLSAHFQIQAGTFTWGGPATNALSRPENLGGALGSRAANIVMRFAYLDWMIPTTAVHVRMGMQPVALPSYTFGSPVLDDAGTGIVVSGAVNDNITVTGLWVRALSQSRRGNAATAASYTDDTLDVFGLVGDFSYDGFAVSPWALFGVVGKDAADLDYGFEGVMPVNGFETPNGFQPSNGEVWMLGLGAELTMFDPFRFTFDAYYGATVNDHRSTERAGWYAALGAEYKTAYGTPALKGWYASGDDNNFNDGSERAPTLSGAFNPTSTYFDGVYGIAYTIDRTSADGTWGVSLQWNGLSFIDKLTHDFAVTYIQGTNHKNNAFLLGANYLTTKDSLVEFDFNTTYMIYQNLAAVLELGYILEDMDARNYERVTNGQTLSFSDGWRAALNFRYKF